ncbi:uncharacterized protein LOC130892898 isoform X2 [Diorhabda carinulata]|nr:uncharacterized protein LOC130892898 isoform X2 [Diorhabda carinulata]
MEYTYDKENTPKYVYLANCNKLLETDQIIQRKRFKRRVFEKIKVFAQLYPPYLSNDEKIGISNEIINMIYKKLQINVIYTYKTQIEGSIINDNFTGMWKILLEGPYDMFAGVVVPEGTEMGYFEQTFSPLEDSSYFAVPYLLEDVERLSIFRIFTTHLWIVIFLILIILGLQFHYIINILKLDRKYTKLEIGFIIFRSLLEVPTFKRPNTTSLKILFTGILFFTMIISNCYKSKLFNSSVNEHSRQVYGTIEDIVNKKLNVGLHAVAKRTMIRSVNFYEKYLAENSIFCSVDSTCLNKTAFEKNFATVKLEKYLKFIIPRTYINEYGTPLIYIMRDFKVNTVFLNYFFKMGHPVYDKFNEYLMIIKENGFVDKIYKDLDKVNLAMMKRYEKTIRFEPMSLFDFGKLFFLYGIAVGVSISIFFSEYLYHFITSHKLQLLKIDR